MRLEDYFDFLSPDDIRIKGHRIGIEHVLHEYIENSLTPQALVERFPSLSLEQIHATILYYLSHKREIDQYMKEWHDAGERAWAEQQANPSPQLIRLRERIAELKAKRQEPAQ